MGKNKLARFAENETFANLFQLTYEQITKEGFALKGKWNEDFFKNDNPIVLELGCGKGEYTVGLAKKYPNKNFIGIDIKGARLWRGCKTSNEDKMTNVAFVRTHIQMIESYFAENEVSEIWITFPDPQLKKPNKRLTCERFLKLYKNILKQDGIVHLKTDSQELYEYTKDEVLIPSKREILYNTNDLYNSDFKEDVIEIQTFYESMYLKIGKPITYLKFKLT
ncbi:MAG: tRNA (guanosine(46)-N7)-methyltransferase TrmB [Bacteroidales bacterium]|nr:tRNA (guanosine(46)-N7)-methyltransferase TrmB [Bacteroidales bacterium]MEE0889735.1 tRNA (guanosine(46)-N7)-methyltransferase TrmB [Bacteroidales bacterium]MEE1226244.1 tRNA (guanosine(46)-N7)-methyltransferase TrmB [Bacteroidales bacterium]MEE1302736.1 tRNA (guanosine(46)-N7)-methyltransferase TrmB [Bacteroidales bacterium]